MNVSEIGNSFGLGGSTGIGGGGGGNNPFLQLVVTELQNQNPLEPTSNTEFLGQLAQFSTLEQLEALNTNLTQQAAYNQFGQAANLVGKEVSYLDRNGESVRGRADSVTIQGTNVFVDVNGQAVPIESVIRVYAADETVNPEDTSLPPGDGQETPTDRDTDSE